MFFSSSKAAHFVSLLLLAIVLLILFFVSPTPDLLAPVSSVVGIALGALSASAGEPLFLMMVSLLCLSPLLMRLSLQRSVSLWWRFALILLLSFMLKTGLKQFTAVPRPYVVSLVSLQLTPSTSAFYAANANEKQQIVTAAAKTVSHWRTQHWQGEMNYSFPSGHTIFAAVCVVFWSGFFWRAKAIVPLVLLMSWAAGVAGSRVYLGMHYPADILASVIFAGLLYLFIPIDSSS
ncbi:phosphatase PAP2 family protein [Thaumasiovibrio sp. DFM-14]|uniref:phosphatase PAP2 family protein n=1 Tax=Thaumasiovibrio sp. DFM-14 TaxID=3384792 RepID=UPI0039A2CE73